MGHDKPMKINLPGALLLLAAVAVSHAATTDFERAEEHYQRTDYGAALNLLLSLPSKDAAVYALIGRAYYMDGRVQEFHELFGKEPSPKIRAIPATTIGWVEHTGGGLRSPVSLRLFHMRTKLMRLRAGRGPRSIESGSAEAICSNTTFRPPVSWEEVWIRRRESPRELAG